MPPSSPRRRRFNIPGHAHELTFQCFHGFPFLQAERTCRWLAKAIETARRERAFDLWAYVFMPNHVHLIVRPRRTEYDVAAILRAVKEPVSRRAVAHLKQTSEDWLQRIAVRRGQRVEHRFWQAGGGYDRNIDQSQTLLKMIDYLHLNPVRKQLVERAEDWMWSSAGWFAGRPQNELRPDPIPGEVLRG